MGSLPPSSSTSRFKVGAQASMTRFPTAELPVMATMWTLLDATSCAPT